MGQNAKIAAGLLCVLFTSCDESPDAALTETQNAHPTAAEVTEIFKNVCATCHGLAGEGNQEIGAPSIAGMPAWYAELQLTKYRNGVRGNHPDDLEGVQMRAMAAALQEEWLKPLSEHVAALAPIPTENTLGGDPDAHAWVYADYCMACHRFNGGGERVFRSAPLTNLPDWYLASALRKYRAGIRGADAIADNDAWKMHETTQILDEESIVNLVAHIASLAEKFPPGERRRKRQANGSF